MSGQSPMVEVAERGDPEQAIVLDPSTLDPALHYRFVQMRPENVSRKKLQGYSVVSRTKSGVKTLVELDPGPDDSIRVGDTILMACPKDRHASRVARRKQIASGRLAASEQRMKEKVEEAKASGVRVGLTTSLLDRGEPSDGGE